VLVDVLCTLPRNTQYDHPVASEKRLQLVPNWNGMTMPVTTPIPNAIEKP
jgi:hypothetical protein